MKSQTSKRKEFIKAIEEYVKAYRPKVFISNTRVEIQDYNGNRLGSRDIVTGIQSRRTITNRMV